MCRRLWLGTGEHHHWVGWGYGILLSEGSEYGDKGNLLHSHFTKPRSDVIAKPWLTPSALILSETGGAGARQGPMSSQRTCGTQHASQRNSTDGICHLHHGYRSNPLGIQVTNREPCKQTPTPLGTVTSTKLLLSRQGHGAHTTQGAQWEWTVKKMGENTLKLNIQV